MGEGGGGVRREGEALEKLILNIHSQGAPYSLSNFNFQS